MAGIWEGSGNVSSCGTRRKALEHRKQKVELCLGSGEPFMDTPLYVFTEFSLEIKFKSLLIN
jgi:hypothetical protein